MKWGVWGISFRWRWKIIWW